ncbi:putative transposase YbfD/YdcC [Aquamicrobium terrae]|uniref:Transposase YbfD/YdcC n=1 Tax=Aquamicrobium terrae TaxID=1324945 RepID=A0ABV2MY73_9HYPH
MSWFARAFESLPDPRTGNAQRHDLLEVLVMALTAAVCGAETCSDFADFAVDRADLFGAFLRLENGVPSHDTFSRIFRLLDPDAFAACFGRFVTDLGAAGAGVVAIDGKTLRRSFDTAASRCPLAVVTAFASATHTVIGQESFRVSEGDSEILAARALLNCLDLTGQLVTADALHCQNDTAQLILDRGGDYLLRLKSNRPALHRMVKEYFADPAIRGELAVFETTDADHGRIERRRAYVSHDLDWLLISAES